MGIGAPSRDAKSAQDPPAGRAAKSGRVCAAIGLAACMLTWTMTAAAQTASDTKPAAAEEAPAEGSAAEGTPAEGAPTESSTVPAHEFNPDIFGLDSNAGASGTPEKIPEVTPLDQRSKLVEGLPGDHVNAAYSDEVLTPDSAIVVPPAPVPPPEANVATLESGETQMVPEGTEPEMPAVPSRPVTPEVPGAAAPAPAAGGAAQPAPTGAPGAPATQPTSAPESMTATVQPTATPRTTGAAPSMAAPGAPAPMATGAPGMAPAGGTGILATPISRVPKVVADRAAKVAGAGAGAPGATAAAEPTVANQVGFNPAAPRMPPPVTSTAARVAPSPADKAAAQAMPESQMFGTATAGQPATLRAARQSEQIAVIFFGQGSASLTDRDRAVLADVAVLQRQSGGRLRVVGHASQWTASTNPLDQELANYRVSLDRANAVAAELQRQGVGGSSIDVVARSDSQPLYWETMPSGQAGNRRVEIYLDF
jgi:outer membrane protein OmpA-like peptidoglycan-associated protein